MRVLLAGPVDAGDAVNREIDGYLKAGHELVVNTAKLPDETVQAARARYADKPVAFVSFDPAQPTELQQAITAGNAGFEAVIYPPNISGFTADVMKAAKDNALQHRLQLVGCPNDAVDKTLSRAADEQQVPVMHTPGIHAPAVAEYTLLQMGFLSRQFNQFHAETGTDGAWPHDKGATETNMLAGRTLGVLGGSGKDGGAVIALAKKMGMRVVAMGSGRAESDDKIRGLGAEVAATPRELFEQADFISVNMRNGPDTAGMINRDAIASMKKGVIIVDPAGAEIFDKEALLEELRKAPKDRTLGKVILDMPYGGRRDDKAFTADPANAVLKELGVLFTPRIAGYTREIRMQAVDELARHVNDALQGRFAGPVANKPGNLPPPPPVEAKVISELDEAGRVQLAKDIVELAKEAGETAIKLRRAGLTTAYNDDGSPTTNADKEATRIIHDGLKKKGYSFNYSGEEQAVEKVKSDIEIIIDGIDGTNNFKNGNFGWCTSVAVKQAGETVIGVVHDAECDKTYSAVKGKGAYMRDRFGSEKLSLPEDYDPKFQFSMGSFQAPGMTETKNKIISDMKKLGGRERSWGSIALSICAVAQGGWGAFIQGNSKEYDHVAARLIATEAGAGVSCEPSRQRLREQGHDVELSDVIVTHPKLLEQVKRLYHLRASSPPPPTALS
jgi:myo-inositol-1(or 4)-monophosphatase